MRYLLTYFLFSTAFAAPSKVYLIRHAEKPSDDRATILSPEGFARAEALLKLFDGSFSDFTPPDFLYASRPRNSAGSIRSIQTLTPISKAKKIDLNQDYNVDAYAELSAHLLKADNIKGKTVLIAWGKDEIPDLAKSLGAKCFPKSWPKKTFDRVWTMKFENERVVKCEDLPMKLMPKDSNR